jgi:hypothetical protein
MGMHSEGIPALTLAFEKVSYVKDRETSFATFAAFCLSSIFVKTLWAVRKYALLLIVNIVVFALKCCEKL